MLGDLTISARGLIECVVLGCAGGLHLLFLRERCCGVFAARGANGDSGDTVKGDWVVNDGLAQCAPSSNRSKASGLALDARAIFALAGREEGRVRVRSHYDS